MFTSGEVVYSAACKLIRVNRERDDVTVLSTEQASC